MEKESRKSFIIIIVLVALIAVSGSVLAYAVLSDKKADSKTPSESQQETTAAMSNADLEAQLGQMPMYADGVKYYYASSSEQLEYDAMGATVFNNSDVNVQSFTVAFCAFDENGKPIKIRQPNEGGDGAFVRTISFDLSKTGSDKKYIEPSESFDNAVFYVTNEPQIVTIKACVKSYASVDGVSWNNPLYNTFKLNYSGKNLTDADN